MDDGALIQYKNVEIHQQELCVLSDVNLELHKGEFVYLIGKVGSGKTSLLKTLYGELDVIDGEAEVLGYNMRSIKRKHIPQLRRKLGIVFQDFQLLTDRTVYNNLEFVLRATGWKNKQEIQDRIEEVLQLVGMSNKGYKLPNELSGGEQQRIVIARAVLNSPAIILADEPTGNLDVETGKAIVELLHNICESGSSVVMTTHNLQLLKDYPGRVYRCADHQIVDVTDEYMPRQRTIEQQRIVIARAVLNSPAIILADEPTGNLDVETGKSIVELLHNICESGSSVVMTTHNLQLLKEYPGSVYRCSEHRITDVTDEYMPRQRTIEIDLNIDN